MTLPVVAIVGLSDSGKTLVACALVRTLSARGYRVVAVKHCPHGHQVDTPGTDTHRLYAAGAARVIASSPGQISTVQRTEGDTSLEQIVAELGVEYDLVVAEGFKASAAPKVVVGDLSAFTPPSNVIAVVEDGAMLPGAPRYGFGDMDALADRICREVAPAPAATRVTGAPAGRRVPRPGGPATS